MAQVVESLNKGPLAKSTKAGRVPSLDGLRAISILMVLVGHLQGTKGFPRVDFHLGDYSHLGVVVFFVISGYLITRLMMVEEAEDGSVSLKSFYARRALRLFPAAYVYISCIALLWAAGIVHIEARDLWHAVTYTMNFETYRSWQLGHLWSLSIEEQFYLIWPCIFVLLRPRQARWVPVAAIFIGPIARAAALIFLKGTPYLDLELFPMVADSIATGCVLALFGERLEQNRWYARLFHPAYSVALVVLVFVMNDLMVFGVVDVIGTTVVNFSLAVLIHRSIRHSDDLVGRFLNWRPVAFVGVLSYSLYLWQQLFIFRHSSAWINRFPQNVLLVVAAALASYYLLEKPLLRLRASLHAHGGVQTPPAAGLNLLCPQRIPVQVHVSGDHRLETKL